MNQRNHAFKARVVEEKKLTTCMLSINEGKTFMSYLIKIFGRKTSKRTHG